MPDLWLTPLFQGFYLTRGKVFMRFVGKATNLVVVKIVMKNLRELI